MHFERPFVAGEYPSARYGHACCKVGMNTHDEDDNRDCQILV